MPKTTAYVTPLAALDASDGALAGGKGANLGELIAAGFAVPEGFVVTTRLYREALRAADIIPAHVDPTQRRALIEALTIPPALAAEIVRAYRELGEGPVAVRSSATAEDLPSAAFAGQQESFLHVLGGDAVVAAVRGCWASLWGERAVAYRERLEYAAVPEIAVVVQRMVPSEFAGVLFTANPVTGVRDEVVIDASPGLGDAVVSGLVTPQHVVIDRRGRIRERRAGRSEVIIRGLASGGVSHEKGGGSGTELRSAVLTELAAVGVKVGTHFGRPQDIEWAYANGSVWVVQARPITALPPPPVKANRIQRASAAMSAELLPTRPYPLDVTAWTIPGWFTILARMMAEVPAITVDVQRMLPEADGVVTQLLPPEPRPSWRTLTAPLRIRDRRRRFDPARWTRDPRFAAYEQRLEMLRGQDLSALGWSELMAVPGRALDLLDSYVDLRIDYLPAMLSDVVRFGALLTVLGLSSDFWPLLSGQPTQTLAANRALQAIAEQIPGNKAWAEAFATPGDDELVAAVWHTDEFAPLRLALQHWLAAFGHRETTSGALVSAPTWEDDPRLLLGTLRGLVASPGVPMEHHDQAVAAERRVTRLRRVRATHTEGRIRRAAQSARSSLVFREDSHFHALRVRPVVRSALLEAGNRLARVGVLSQRDDVFHLRLDELRELTDPSDLGPERRSRLREVVRQRTVRRSEFGQAPLISPATLFPGLLRATRGAANALVSGTPGGGGRATGQVRIIRGPSEFGRLRTGDVLVCPYTNPAWTPLFEAAVAVVADAGSFGSHAAIVAREYGIPAVMGTGNGSQVLTEGMVVVVDGARGHVVAANDRGHG